MSSYQPSVNYYSIIIQQSFIYNNILTGQTEGRAFRTKNFMLLSAFACATLVAEVNTGLLRTPSNGFTDVPVFAFLLLYGCASAWPELISRIASRPPCKGADWILHSQIIMRRTPWPPCKGGCHTHTLVCDVTEGLAMTATAACGLVPLGRGLAIRLQRPSSAEQENMIHLAAESLRQKIWRFLPPPFSREARVCPVSSLCSTYSSPVQSPAFRIDTLEVMQCTP